MVRYGKRSYRRSTRKTTRKRSRVYKRNTTVAYRALRIAKSASKRVAGEVCKFESNPLSFSNSNLRVGPDTTNFQLQTRTFPLRNITSGTPYVYPINWVYISNNTSNVNGINPAYVDGERLLSTSYSLYNQTVSVKYPIWYNTLNNNLTDPNDDVSTQLQYRLKYIYINAIFNASVAQSQNNTDGALRIVIVKDKQPTAGAATWFVSDENNTTLQSRGVFNANRINAQLNPRSVGRFKIMYDKTLRFTTINGYKPFKYFKNLSTVVRNNSQIPNYDSGPGDITQETSQWQTSSAPCPVQKNAFYLMMFPDGVSFANNSTESSTPAAGFNLFCRVAYYNN